MTDRTRTLLVRTLHGAGIVLAACGGVLLHSAVPATLGPAVALTAPLAVLVVFALVAVNLNVTPNREHPAPGAGRRRTILLVDDEPMIRHLGQTVLERAGYRVLTAEDGTDAVEVFTRERDRISLVILDAVMPRMSGPDAFRRMTALDPAARVLFSSGYSPEDLAALEGSVGLLPKPYRPEGLLAAVRDALTAPATPATAG